MKKLLLMVLGMLMMFSTFARDFTYEYEGQTLTYKVLDEEAKTCTTKKGYNVSGSLIIPAVAKDDLTEYTVISIDGDAFSGCSDLTSVTIPNSVKTIGFDAFYGCI